MSAGVFFGAGPNVFSALELDNIRQAQRLADVEQRMSGWGEDVSREEFHKQGRDNACLDQKTKTERDVAKMLWLSKQMFF
jgi:hypothetical protein